MDGGGFYRDGSSVTRSFPRNSGDRFDFGGASHPGGSMYEFPSGGMGAAVSGVEQKLDMVVSLVMEQKALSATIESGTNELKGVVNTLVSDVAYLKDKVAKTPMNSSSPNGSVRKKIPSELSVSFYVVRASGIVRWRTRALGLHYFFLKQCLLSTMIGFIMIFYIVGYC